MSEVTIYINGRSYNIFCDNGQEARVSDLAAYIDQRLQQISRSGAAYNDAHLMVLASIVLADELFDAREAGKALKATSPAVPTQPPVVANKEDDAVVLRVIEQLTRRVEIISARVQQAS